MANKIRFRDLSGGINRAVNDGIMKDSEALYVLNMRPDRLGAWKVRQGYTQVGDTVQANKIIRGLHQFIDKSGTKTVYAVSNNSGDTAGQLRYLNGSTWTTLTATIPKDRFIEFASFINYAFMCGDGMVTQSIAGGAANPSTTTNVTGAPQGLYPIVYKDRLYIINITDLSGTAYPSRFYWSSIPSGSPLSITWDTANDYESFSEDDGSGIVGAIVAHDRLYLFKDNKFGFWDNTQMRELYGIGCAHHRTIKEYNGIIYWMDKKGAIWAFDGSAPIKISTKVEDYTNFGAYAASFGYVHARVDHKAYYIFIANPAWPDVKDNFNSLETYYTTPTYNNGAELAYFFDTGAWAVNGYANWLYISAVVLDSFDTLYHYVGADDGNVYLMAQGEDGVFADAGSAIQYVYLSKNYDLGAPEEEKYIIEGYPYGKNLESTNFGININDQKDDLFLQRVEKKRKLPMGKAAHSFRFIYSGVDSQSQPIIEGAGFDIKLNSN